MSGTAVTAPSRAWLEAVLVRSQALLLEGPAGIGKTHLWNAGVAAAGEAGWRVLRAQPAQAEVRLVGSALIDLCDDVTDEELCALPEVQARALSGALVRTTPGDAPTTAQAVALAFTGLVRRMVQAGPVLLAVDDVQWLDAETAAVLSFAARRTPHAGLGLLLARRSEPTVAPPEVVADLAAALPLTRAEVPPLGRDALARLVHERVGPRVTPAMLRSALDAAQGNPLFAVEVARVLLRRDPALHPGADVFPDSLAELVGRHVEALPEQARLGLAAASALRRPTVRQLRELGLADSLAAAEHAGLVRVSGHDVVFLHPMYAAAAYDRLGGSQRMRLHARLAVVVEGEEERARHLALGADAADEQVALALDVAAERALARGALHAALDACRLALHATPAGSPHLARRRTRHGRLLYRLGDVARAREELTAAASLATGPLDRARALHELARVVNDTASQHRAAALEREALAVLATAPEPDDDLLADVHLGLSVSAVDDWAEAVRHAERACALLERVPAGAPGRTGAALTGLVAARWHAGLGADLALCRRAVALEADAVELPVADRAVCVLAALLVWTDDFPAARVEIARATALAVEEGDEPSRGYLLSLRAELELLAGDWATARQCNDAWLAICERSDIPSFAHMARQYAAWLTALGGDTAGAAAALADDLLGPAPQENPHVRRRAHGILGFCALARGDADEAVRQLDAYTALYGVTPHSEPALRVFAGDHVEALVASGRLDDADAHLARLVEPATRLGRTAVLASAARGQALLAAARGDATAAVAAADRSLALYDLVERRFDRARALLTKGQVHRRFKQKALARDALTAARDAFTELRAAGFAERAAAELGRVGLRPPASLDLTETERQVAQLAAAGLTSAEMAGSLFLSTKTVSANLTRIYRKLGVRNRSELTARLGRQGS